MTDNWQMRAIAAEALNSDLEEENERLRVEVATLKAKLEGKEPPADALDINKLKSMTQLMQEMMETPPKFRGMDFSGLEEKYYDSDGQRHGGYLAELELSVYTDELNVRYIARLHDKTRDKHVQYEIEERYAHDDGYLMHIGRELCRAIDVRDPGVEKQVGRALQELCHKKGITRGQKRQGYYGSGFDRSFLDESHSVPNRSKPKPEPKIQRKGGAGRTGAGDTGGHPRSPFQRGGGKG